MSKKKALSVQPFLLAFSKFWNKIHKTLCLIESHFVIISFPQNWTERRVLGFIEKSTQYFSLNFVHNER